MTRRRGAVATKRPEGLAVTRDAVVVNRDGRIDDPRMLMPLVELAVRLRRGLAGVAAQGPFR